MNKKEIAYKLLEQDPHLSIKSLAQKIDVSISTAWGYKKAFERNESAKPKLRKSHHNIALDFTDLPGAILWEAYTTAQNPNVDEKDRQDALRFLRSQDAVDWANWSSLDPDAFRKWQKKL